jgi:hypothetical protein
MIGDRDHDFCRLALPSSLFFTITQVFPPSNLPDSFATNLLEGIVHCGLDHEAPGLRVPWCDIVSQVLNYALLDPVSDIARVIRTRVLEENDVRSRALPGTADAHKSVWGTVLECAVKACAETQGFKWENIILFMQAIPHVALGLTEEVWSDLVEKAFEAAEIADVSPILVIEKTVPALTSGRFGYVLLFVLRLLPQVLLRSSDAKVC